MRTLLCSGVLSLMLGGALGQVAPPQPAFEAADIKPNKSGQIRDDYFTILPGGVFVAHNAKLSQLFEYAFKVRRDAISAAPSWFDGDRVDITAKANPSATDEELRSMLRSLLIKEFRIVLHIERKSMSAFVLVVGKGGPRLLKSAARGRADCKHGGEPGLNSGGSHLTCSNMTIAELRQGLPDLAPDYIDRPVVDATGLRDAYDFRLDWIARKSVENDGGPTIFTAVEKLGLKFEQRKELLPAIIIDHMDRLSATLP